MSQIEELEPRRIAGMIQDRFRIGDTEYVHSRVDPYSFYKPVLDNNLRDITNPFEITLARLVYNALFR